MTKNFKNKKELLFLEPIKPEMTVDDIFNRLMKYLKKKVSKFILIKLLTKELNNGQN